MRATMTRSTRCAVGGRGGCRSTDMRAACKSDAPHASKRRSRNTRSVSSVAAARRRACRSRPPRAETGSRDRARRIARSGHVEQHVRASCSDFTCPPSVSVIVRVRLRWKFSARRGSLSMRSTSSQCAAAPLPSSQSIPTAAWPERGAWLSAIVHHGPAALLARQPDLARLFHDARLQLRHCSRPRAPVGSTPVVP